MYKPWVLYEGHVKGVPVVRMLLVAMPGAPNVASLLLVVRPGARSSFLLLGNQLEEIY